MSQCSICHGENMAGSPPAFPSLIGVGTRLTPPQITATIKNGKGRMPGFPNLTDDQTSALVGYLTSGENKEMAVPARISANAHDIALRDTKDFSIRRVIPASRRRGEH